MKLVAGSSWGSLSLPPAPSFSLDTECVVSGFTANDKRRVSRAFFWGFGFVFGFGSRPVYGQRTCNEDISPPLSLSLGVLLLFSRGYLCVCKYVCICVDRLN